MAATLQTPAYSAERLIGSQVQLWPYQRGAYTRDAIYYVWLAMETAQAAPHLFWGNTDHPAFKGDLTAFCEYFDTVAHPDRMLLIVESRPTKAIAGFVWFDDIIPHHRCFGSIFMVPAYRGEASKEVMRMACDYAFHALDLKAVWGVTPWRKARVLIEQGGFERMADLPEFGLVEGKPTTAYVYRLTRARFDDAIST